MKVRIEGRPVPHDKNCTCAKSPIYTKFFWFPTLTLWAMNTRRYTWGYWSLLITGINK